MKAINTKKTIPNFRFISRIAHKHTVIAFLARTRQSGAIIILKDLSKNYILNITV